MQPIYFKPRRLALPLLAVVLATPLAWTDTASTFTPGRALRRPVALAAVGRHLYIANQRTGSVTVMDADGRVVVGELAVGGRLSDLAVSRDGRWLIVTDQQRDEAVLLRADGPHVEVVHRLKVAMSPVAVTWSPDGRSAYVASLWARRVTRLVVDRREGGTAAAYRLRADGVIDLPFAPRAMQYLAGRDRLVVADAFAGRLAIVDTTRQSLVSQRSIQGHNLRGLTLNRDGKSLMIAHQMLDSSLSTTRPMVFYGFVISNLVRVVELDHLLDAPTGERAAARPIAHWSLHPLGQQGDAAGDPGGLAVTRDGRTVVALSGVDEVAVRPAPHADFVRLEVGRRPTAVALSPDQRTAYVANTFDDSVSIVDLTDPHVAATVALGPTAELNEADRGELLFYDARLSLHGWYSCHSCHTDGHTIGLLNDNFGDDTFGTPKRVLSLLGAADTGPWAWRGTQQHLEDQVRKSIDFTMQGAEQKSATDQRVSAIAAFVRTLGPPTSLAKARGGDKASADAVARGRRVFEKHDCTRCHRPPTYTSTKTFDVGVADESGEKRFNPPSLRGVSQRSAYFHDNRARTLREVFTKHRHADGEAMSDEDIEALVAFLNRL